MDTSQNDKLFKQIIMIYSLSEFDNQINTSLNENESAYSALLNVLNYYKNSVQLDSNHTNSILEKYLELSEKELRKKIGRL